ncbi:MAG: FIST C-terminal domain-containing protein [Oligoflexia bacterium]|nr:FIST C-terminal domain-containing protein [Oligoflexia bacterium]
MTPHLQPRGIGIGSSHLRNSQAAGEEAARQAIAQLGGSPPRFSLVFAGAGHDPQALLRGARASLGEVPLSGCSASGIILAEGWDDSPQAATVLVMAEPRMSFTTYRSEGFGRDSAACGRALGRRIRDAGQKDGKLLLVFPDGLTGNVSLALRSLEEELPYPVAIAGGTAGELLRMGPTWQFHDGAALTDSITAALLGGDFLPEISVTHACDPIGIEQTITRARDGWVHEIDGAPAWDVYRQYLEVQDVEEITMSHFCYICLAELLPEPDPFYGSYIIRCPLRLDRGSGALFFPGEMRTGTRVRMALRNPETTVARARRSAELIRSRHPGASPRIVLQFDCCCRARLLFGARTHETSIAPVQRVFGEVPWLGFNTYGEIAAIDRRRTLFHNYSMVLCALYDG